jgi:hypothetical protein
VQSQQPGTQLKWEVDITAVTKKADVLLAAAEISPNLQVNPDPVLHINC